MTTIDLSSLYATDGTARLVNLDEYVAKAKETAVSGGDVTLTGPAPVWLYLRVAHALHGLCRKLVYTSPVSGDVVIFDHTP
ncbi:MAG: hypothetical protein GX804_05530 [Lentisphaerae bacterium]|jgi:hypothetical protein|nr:hypothetical protein [Lentisphaerota bacterium]